MTDWATLQEAVRDAVALALEMPDFTGADGTTSIRRVEWSERESAMRWGDSSWADLTLGAVRATGRGETRVVDFAEEATPADSSIAVERSNYSVFTVSVRVGNGNQDPGSESVGALGGKLRIRLGRDDVKEILQTGGVAIVGVEASIKADFVEPGSRRIWSSSLTDIIFSCVETDEEDEVAYVDRVDSDPNTPAPVLERPDETQIELPFDYESADA